MSSAVSATPAGAKSNENKIKHRRLRPLFQLLKLLVFLGCAIFSVYQINANEPLSPLYKRLDSAEYENMENAAWDSVSSYYQVDKFSKILFLHQPSKQNSGLEYAASPRNGTPAFAREVGVCLYFKPWEKITSKEYVSIFAHKDVFAVYLRFAHNVDDVYKLNLDVLDKQNYHEISLAKQRHILVEIKETTRLSVKEHTCSSEEGYFQGKCRDKCVGDHFKEYLNVTCGLPWFKPGLDAPTCTNYKNFFTFGQAMTNTSNFLSLQPTCEKQCPEACTKLEYKVMMSPSDVISSYKFVLVTVDPTVKVMEEFASYKFMNMFGDVGGIVGILLGFSIFGIYTDLSDYVQKQKGLN